MPTSSEQIQAALAPGWTNDSRPSSRGRARYSGCTVHGGIRYSRRRLTRSAALIGLGPNAPRDILV